METEKDNPDLGGPELPRQLAQFFVDKLIQVGGFSLY